MKASLLSRLVTEHFPKSGLSLAFGYGSRITKQTNSSHYPDDLVDLIFAVDNPLEWHTDNLKNNKAHYSFLRYFPDAAAAITTIQENYGAAMYFNPYVELDQRLLIKYGTIKTSHLIGDLTNWDHLYVAGRLHKPVEFIVNSCDKNETLRAAFKFNKESALRAALLQLPEIFNPQQLYEMITGLSYRGDPRMIFGEDRDKIRNIVGSQIDRFQQLYLPMIKLHPSFKECITWSESKQQFSQELTSSTVLRHLKALPSSARRKVCELHESEARSLDADAILTSASRSLNCDQLVGRALASIVRRSSLSQSFKGLMTAGLAKSIKYSQRKLLKSISSRFRFNKTTQLRD